MRTKKIEVCERLRKMAFNYSEMALLSDSVSMVDIMTEAALWGMRIGAKEDRTGTLNVNGASRVCKCGCGESLEGYHQQKVWFDADCKRRFDKANKFMLK